MDPLYIHSEDFITAQETGLKSVIGAWKRLDAYPEAVYAKLRSSIRLSDKIRKRDAALTELMEKSTQVLNDDELNSILKDWNKLLHEQIKDTSAMNILLDDIRASVPMQIGGDKNEDNKKNMLADQSFMYGNMPINLLLRYYSQQYEKMLRADFDFAEERAGQFMTANWNPDEWRKLIQIEEKKTISSLGKEINQLHKNIDDLRNTPLYKWKQSEKTGVSGYLYDILNKFYAEAVKAKSLSLEEIEKNDFKTNWLKTQQMTKETLDRFDAVVRPYAENDEIAQAAASVRKMLVLQAQSDRYRVLHHEIERLPLTQAELENFVAQNTGKENIFDFSPELAQETFGDVSYAEKYDPKTVKQMLEDVFVIARSFLKNKKDQSTAFLDDGEQYEEKLGAFEKYLENFIDYWGTYPEKAYAEQTSWESFKKRAAVIKAFKINSLLQSVYTQSLNILKGMDDTALSEDIKKKKSKYIAVLNDRISMLTPLHTDAAQKMVNAWADLPDSAEEAWKRLTSLTDKELRTSFFGLKTQGERGQIAWWNDFSANGVALLKKENEENLKKDLMAQEEDNSQNEPDGKKPKKRSFGLLSDMSAFPLCRDCNTGRTLTSKEMKKLTETLKTVAAEPSAAEQENKGDSLIDKQLSLFPDQDSLDWAGNVLKVSSALTDEKNPLVWTLLQAPVDSQTALLSGNEIAAVNRFRYVEVKTDAAKAGKRFGTASAQETAIGQGRAASAVTLNFYKSSADTEPEAQLRLGEWAALRVYLKSGAYTDPQSGKMYVPLTVKDKTGAKFIYVVGIKISRPVLKPDEWPTKKNWKNAVASIQNSFETE